MDFLALKWLGKLSQLRTAIGGELCKGKAPHKPLLLLSLFDMAEAGMVTSRMLTRTPELVLRFKTYGALVTERWPTKLDMRMPFYYLKTQQFWQPFTSQQTPAASPETCTLCEMDQEFFTLLSDPVFREKARLLLLFTYFERKERLALLESMGLATRNLDTIEWQMETITKEAAQAAKRKGRSARFKVQVVSTYQFTCALTGFRCLTGEGAVVVDAAHIEQWARSQNDELTNGLALCKNAHWMFDEGLWSVGGDGRIIVARERFSESGPQDLKLATYHGRRLCFAEGVKLRPNMEALEQHRHHHGFAL